MASVTPGRLIRLLDAAPSPAPVDLHAVDPRLQPNAARAARSPPAAKNEIFFFPVIREERSGAVKFCGRPGSRGTQPRERRPGGDLQRRPRSAGQSFVLSTPGRGTLSEIHVRSVPVNSVAFLAKQVRRNRAKRKADAGRALRLLVVDHRRYSNLLLDILLTRSPFMT